jgi:hypothetical protein
LSKATVPSRPSCSRGPPGPREPTKRDDFAAAVLVAVPPWTRETVRAYGRAGNRLDITVVDADPPEETLEDSLP